MIHALLAAVMIAAASPSAAPTAAPAASTDPGAVQRMQIGKATAYANQQCLRAGFGQLVNARIDGTTTEPGPFPLGPWRLFCTKGVLVIGWSPAK